MRQQEYKSQHKSTRTPLCDDSWERTTEAQFGFTVEIDPDVREVHGGEPIQCHAIYIDRSTSLAAVVRTIPRVSK
jgi:hypothetical protein